MDDTTIPRVIMLMGDDPRSITADWCNIDGALARISIVAYVVPYARVNAHAGRAHQRVPLIPWELAPRAPMEALAREYLALYRTTRAEFALCFNWKVPLIGTEEDREYIYNFDTRFPLYRHFTGKTMSRLIHRVVHGCAPRRS